MDRDVCSLACDSTCYLCASGYVCVHPPPATWLFLFRNQLDNRYSVQGLGRAEA